MLPMNEGLGGTLIDAVVKPTIKEMMSMELCKLFMELYNTYPFNR
jgi:hypothetical protein